MSDGFVDTRWSLIQRVAGGGEDAPAALATLCEIYAPPIYEYVRRLRRGRPDAEDVTQAFFMDLIERNVFGSARPERGKLRALLVTSARNFVRATHREATRQKRGGGAAPLSLDADMLDQIDADIARDPDTDPERALERKMARQLLARARRDLEAEWKAKQWDARWHHLSPFLAAEPPPGHYQQLAPTLDLKPTHIGVTVHRMRERFVELVGCYTDAADADAEVAELRRIEK